MATMAWNFGALYFSPRERGGTGRRAGLRILSRKGCGFDSRRSHSKGRRGPYFACAMVILNPSGSWAVKL
jgi:hypothetical protein